MTDQVTQDAPTLPDHRTAVAGQVERRVRRRVCLTAWQWSADINGYIAPGGWTLRKRGAAWIARDNGGEVLRDEYLFNVMMELCG
jgi:hypothetical protein